MGIALPQLAPASEDRVSGAQVIGGSLKFDGATTPRYLTRSLSAGNRKTWTMSYWFKYDSTTNGRRYISTGYNVGKTYGFYIGDNSNLITFNDTGTDAADVNIRPSNVIRDNGWYHLVFNLDTTQSDQYDRARIYINGVEVTDWSTDTRPAQNAQGNMNNSGLTLTIGCWNLAGTYRDGLEGQIAQFYHIDGQALGPGYFGFTDPLTNTWRPKKFVAEGTTVNDGRVFSSTGTFSNWDDDGSYPKTELFDGTLYTGGTPNGACPDDGNPATFDFGNSQITGFENLQINIFLSSNQASATNVVSVNGVDITQDCHKAGNNTWTTVDLGSKFTSLKSFSVANNNIYVGGFIVDGVIMKDSTTQNLAFGTNGFYLPLDGNSPIGQDQSGEGHDFTPVNFGGSTDITKATGARPILNTINGGNIAGPGVFGSKAGAFYETTSASNSGGKYVFEGLGTQPTFSFIRGATYTFDWSASSGHPLRFATAADAAGSTEYTDGTNVSGNVTKITVPHNAPDTLYYYCNVHNGMGNSISVTTDETKADPYAWKCTLAIPSNGNDLDYSGFINATTANKATGSDNVAFSGPGDMFYGNNLKLTGDGSNNSRVTIASGAFGFGTGDWTIEFWGHFTAVGDQGNRNARILTPSSESGTYIQILTSNSNATVQLNNLDIPNSKCLNRTRHYVFQRSGTTGELIVDGVLVDTGTENRDFPDVAYQIGRYDGTNGGASLYMADFRVYNGIKKYSTTGKSTGDLIFVPASPAPDIVPDSPSGIATKSKLKKITDGAVSFDGTGDYLEIADNADFEFGTGDFTIEAFFYNQENAVQSMITKYGNSSSDRSFWLGTLSSNNPSFYWYNGSNSYNINGAAGTLPLNKWSHVVAQRTSGDIYLFVDGNVVASNTGSNAALSLNDTSEPVVIGSDSYASNEQPFQGFISNVRIVKGTGVYSTLGCTPPTRELTNVTNTKLLCCQSNTSATAAAVTPGTITGTVNYSFSTMKAYSVYNGGSRGANYTVQYSADGSNWTNAWTGNFSTSGCGLISGTGGGGDYGEHKYWRYQVGSATDNHHPNIARIVLVTTGGTEIDIVTVTADNCSDSGSFNSTTLGATYTNPNNPIATNFNPFNTDINTVRGQESGYATLNPLQTGSSLTLSNGNLALDGASGWKSSYSTIFLPTGKWYAEFTIRSITSHSYGILVGLAALGTNRIESEISGGDEYAVQNGPGNMKVSHNGGSTDLGSQSAYAVGDVLQLAYDADNGKLWFGKNGTYINSGNPSAGSNEIKSGISGTYCFAVALLTTSDKIDCNFGARAYKFPPPDGFQPLNTASVRPDTVIARPEQYFSAKLYTGNGSTSVGGSGGTQTIDVGYKSDLVWIKDLTHGSHDHNLLDTIRGVNSILISNQNVAPVTNSTDAFTAFTDTGFTLGDNGEGTQSLELNKGGNNYVVWSWVAGGSSNTFNVDDIGYASAAAAGLDGGNRNPTAASVGTRQGFSIIKWTGNRSANTTISHGLNSAVKFYFVKNLDRSSDWITWHTGLSGGGSGFIRLNTTGHSGTASSPWSSTIPTDSVFSLGADTETNGDGEDMIAYLWADVPGLQKFGSFTGNGQQNNFVELGFRPAIVWVKRAVANSSPDTSTDYTSWVIMDSARLSYNGLTPNHLYANKNVPPGKRGNGTSTSNLGDMLLEPHSNGFFMNNYGSEVNSNTSQYIYCAWAEQPFSNLYGATSNAR